MVFRFVFIIVLLFQFDCISTSSPRTIMRRLLPTNRSTKTTEFIIIVYDETDSHTDANTTIIFRLSLKIILIFIFICCIVVFIFLLLSLLDASKLDKQRVSIINLNDAVVMNTNKLHPSIKSNIIPVLPNKNLMKQPPNLLPDSIVNLMKNASTISLDDCTDNHMSNNPLNLQNNASSISVDDGKDKSYSQNVQINESYDRDLSIIDDVDVIVVGNDVKFNVTPRIQLEGIFFHNDAGSGQVSPQPTSRLNKNNIEMDNLVINDVISPLRPEGHDKKRHYSDEQIVNINLKKDSPITYNDKINTSHSDHLENDVNSINVQKQMKNVNVCHDHSNVNSV